MYFPIGYQILFALCGPISWMLVFYPLTYRGVKVVEYFKHYIEKTPAEEQASTSEALKSACISIFSNMALTAALLLTIQFATLVVLGDATTPIYLCVYATLFNSLLSSLMNFIVAVHSILALSMLSPNSILLYLNFGHSFFGWKFAETWRTIGVCIILSDLSLLWLTLSFLLFFFTNQTYPFAIALYFLFGIIFLVFLREFSWSLIFTFFEMKLLGKSAESANPDVRSQKRIRPVPN